jgi:hypothetical protein
MYKIKPVLVRLWRKRNLYITVGGNINYYSHFGKQHGGFSKN